MPLEITSCSGSRRLLHQGAGTPARPDNPVQGPRSRETVLTGRQCGETEATNPARRHSMAVVAIAATIIRLLCGGAFVRLVSVSRFTYLADAVVYGCFSSEMVSCRSIPGAVAL